MLKLFKILSEKYNKIKTDFSRSYKFSTGEELDEDIFHNTILKCSEVEKLETMSESAILDYLYRAFRQNMMREKQYHRNKMTDPITEDTEINVFQDENFSENYDYIKLTKYLNQTYGEKLVELLFMWKIDGYSIKELEKKFNIVNLNRKLNKIIKDIKRKSEE